MKRVMISILLVQLIGVAVVRAQTAGDLVVADLRGPSRHVLDRGPLDGPLARDAVTCRTALRHRLGHATTILRPGSRRTGTKATVSHTGRRVN